MPPVEDSPIELIAASDDRTLRDEELEDLIDVEPSPARVTFATQDMSIDALVKRLNRKSMLVPQFGGQDVRVRPAPLVDVEGKPVAEPGHAVVAGRVRVGLQRRRSTR